jgi:hypothetical protein
MSAEDTHPAGGKPDRRLAMRILFDSTQIVKSDTFGFGIDEADYDLLAAESAAVDQLCNGHFLG